VEEELKKFMDLDLLYFEIIGRLPLAIYGMADDEAENRELLQNAWESASDIINFLCELPDSDAIFPDTPQPLSEENQEFESLVRDIEVGVEVLADAISKAIEESAKAPADLVAFQEARTQVLSELNLLHNLLDQAKPLRPVYSYFIPLYSGIKDPQLLILSLEQLGLTVALEADVRGVNNQKVKADIVAILKGEYDIGWLRNPGGSFTLIVDPVALEDKSSKFGRLINSINQQYEQNAFRMIAEALHPLQSALNGVVECLRTVLDGNIENQVERTEFLQRAERSTVCLLEKTNVGAAIELIFNNPHFTDEERETGTSLFEELREDVERIVELMTGALKAIALSPEKIHLLQETHTLASSLLSRNRKSQALLEQIAAPFDSHFSTLRTRITDLQLLKLSLEQLGLTVALDANVRGWKGRKVRADVVAVLDGYCDIGWIRREDGSVELIADLWGVSRSCNHVELINSINRQYGQNASAEWGDRD
jgi:predicted thioesterase